ncbi:ATP-binding protein [Pelomonas sp. KK5]|uniref:ATP-binding protein n=1 Tax=Pelomonas sp. KK5 TaxID=1855730 RepID=UPI0009FB36C8|nr:ATP-binding protein [Pelomonas sp. KK5]
MPQEPDRPAAPSLDDRAAARPALTSGPELERLFQRRMFHFNIGFIFALAPLYIASAIVRGSVANWWMTGAVFGGALLIHLWTRRHGDYRRGLLWLQTASFFSLGLGLGAVQHFAVDTPSFWWMAMIPVVTLMSGLTRLGVLQGVLVMAYACASFLMGEHEGKALASPSLRLHMAVILSSLYVCANLVFATFWRGKLQTALREASDAALASASAKARFLAHMSHEIRTPLSGVIGAAELLRSRRTDEDQRQQLAMLQEQSAKTLLALINDILDWSKLEAGKVQLEQHPLAVRALVSDVNELFAATSFNKQIELCNSCEPEVPRLLLGDPTRIRQVLSNLVGNAVKFTDKGSVHIHVASRRKDAQDWLSIEVRDSGPGIAPDALNDVFDPFRQADQSVTRRYGGTGLGLSISKELAELMGGRIEVESVAGRGSTFTLLLPLRPGEGQSPMPPLLRHDELLVACAGEPLTRHMRSLFNELRIEPRICLGLPSAAALQGCQVLLLDAALLPPGEPPPMSLRHGPFKLGLMQSLGSDLHVEGTTSLYKPVRRSALENFLEHSDAPRPAVAPASIAALSPPEGTGGPHVLLCEDNPVNQVVVQVMLMELGASVVITDNGRAGLEKLRSERFDLVLMDMQMPEMDGLSAAREWRRIEAGPTRLPIVCMTANSRADEGDAALAAGMDDFLAKPFGISDLKQCLARWVTTTSTETHR